MPSSNMKHMSVFTFVVWAVISSVIVLGNPVYNNNCEKNYVNYEATDVNYRLPRSLIPTHYELTLQPDLQTNLFNGSVIITVNVKEATETITLHSQLLNIEDIKVINSENKTYEVSAFRLETVREFLIIDLVEQLTIHEQINLQIDFNGGMSNKIVGLYTSSYLAPDNTTRIVAASKFEPTYARQAFPCFDEPDLKAQFTVNLIRPTDGGYHALSNMNQASSESYGVSKSLDKFAESVPMSTYLACFVVSDLEHESVQVDTKGLGTNFEIRIFASAHQLNKVNFALQTAVNVVEFYIQYFQVEYPLPKLDMAAIPNFGAGAMENWGLLTYRETALLYDSAYSSTWNKQRVATVVAHELAHMWFGNLVTLKWWSEVWLNEGFARFMEYKSVNEIYPSFGYPEQFGLNVLQSVMESDASPASHPIVQTVESTIQIEAIFDTISYDKGASVIRMLEDVVGEEKFAKAVTSYLTEYKYSNAETDDFLAEIEKQQLEFDVKLFMHTWMEQMGFPVVQVKRNSATEFTFEQKRFLANSEDYNVNYNDSNFGYKWTIPLTYFLDINTTISRKWFPYNEPSVAITVPADTKWIKVNSRQVGFYRVNYDDNTWKTIIDTLISNPETFSVADRAHILNDVFAIADASQLTYSTAMSILQYLGSEQDFAPWQVASNKIKDLSVALRYTDTYLDFLKFARNLMSEIYKKVTWTVDEDNHLQNRLRVSILTAACALGLTDCLSEAASRLNVWLDNATEIPAPDLREMVYHYGMQQVGNEATWNIMWSRFINEQDSNEKTKLMQGLAGVRTPWILSRFISLAGNENYVRSQDYFTCLQNIAANPAGESLVWDYVRENLTALFDRFGLSNRYLARLIPKITNKFHSITKLEEMTDFFNKYPAAAAGQSERNQALATVKYNIRWLEENKDQIATWLQIQN